MTIEINRSSKIHEQIQKLLQDWDAPDGEASPKSLSFIVSDFRKARKAKKGREATPAQITLTMEFSGRDGVVINRHEFRGLEEGQKMTFYDLTPLLQIRV